jgi:hypothetical protein
VIEQERVGCQKKKKDSIEPHAIRDANMSTSTGVFAAPAIEDADEATVPEIDHEALALSHARFNPSSRFAKLQRLKEYQQQQSQVAAPVFIRPNEGDDALDGHPIPFQAPVIVDTDVGSKRKRPNDWFELPSHGDDELLVVGVPCMLFRDDQTVLTIIFVATIICFVELYCISSGCAVAHRGSFARVARRVLSCRRRRARQ